MITTHVSHAVRNRLLSIKRLLLCVYNFKKMTVVSMKQSSIRCCASTVLYVAVHSSASTMLHTVDMHCMCVTVYLFIHTFVSDLGSEYEHFLNKCARSHHVILPQN